MKTCSRAVVWRPLFYNNDVFTIQQTQLIGRVLGYDENDGRFGGEWQTWVTWQRRILESNSGRYAIVMLSIIGRFIRERRRKFATSLKESFVVLAHDSWVPNSRRVIPRPTIILEVGRRILKKLMRFTLFQKSHVFAVHRTCITWWRTSGVEKKKSDIYFHVQISSVFRIFFVK